MLVYLKLTDTFVSTRDNINVLLRGNGIDYWIFIENLVIDSYNLKSLKSIKFQNIVDMGSNIGLFSVFAHSIWPKAKIINIEPNPTSIQILKRNTNMNNIHSLLVEKAIAANENLSITLYENENPAMASTLTGKGYGIKVKTTSLKTIVKQLQGISLLKIDIEGGEYELITPSNSKYFKKFNTIIMETHDLNRNKNASKVEKYFKKIGFNVVVNDRVLKASHEEQI